MSLNKIDYIFIVVVFTFAVLAGIVVVLSIASVEEEELRAEREPPKNAYEF